MTRINTPRILLLLLLTVLFSPFHLFAQREIRSITVVNGPDSFTIPAFEHNHQVYASLSHLASRLSLRTVDENTKGKMEIVLGPKRLKFTANNPFIVVISHKENTIDQVYQLPFEVVRSESSYYIPVAQASPLLASVWKASLQWNESTKELHLDAAAAASPSTPITKDEPGKTGTTRASEEEPRLAPKQAVEEIRTAFDIPRLTVDARMNGTLVRIHGAKRLGSFSSKPSGSKLVVEINNATVDENEIRQTPISGEDLLSVSAAQDARNTRIEFQLAPHVTAEDITRDADGNDLLLLLYRRAEVQKIFTEEQQEKKKKKPDATKSKWGLDVIVIDPGHGGKDPGAIGLTGIKEKNITLGISLKLGDLIKKKMKGVKVIFTRDDDRFIELYRRGKIANETEGKLFISIHCNSTEQKPTNTNGFEVYLLRPGRTEEAIRVAEFENSVIKFEKDYETRYKNMSSESFIIASMAQSAYVKYSERFAELVHDEVKSSKHMKSLGVKQAGFFVLVGASMPSVLIEAGFLSNTKDEAFLASQEGQLHMARLIYDAVEKFAEEYEKSLKE